MSIVTGGWGSSVISVWGWGAGEAVHIPSMVAFYLETHAYSCVLTRDYIDLIDRSAGTVLTRISLSGVSTRDRDMVLDRVALSPLSSRRTLDYVLARDYVNVVDRSRGDIILRVKLEDMPERTASILIDRSVSSAIVRSAGWPEQSGEICDE
jgi:hypothetical protein